VIPFTYRNRSGNLVGFDISYAYQLARDLHVRLALAPIEWDEVEADLAARRLDIVMAGAYITEKRLEDLQVSNPYFESPLGFIAPSHQASRFLSYQAVADTPNLVLGTLADSAIFRLTKQLFPKAAHRSARNLRRYPCSPGARRGSMVARPGPGLGVGARRIFGGCSKRHGSAAAVCILSAAERHDAGPISEHVVVVSGDERLSRSATRLLDRRQAAP